MIRISENYQEEVQKIHAQAHVKDYSDIYVALGKVKNDVIADGDDAVKKYTKQFDGLEVENYQIRVSEAEIREAYNYVPKEYVVAAKKAKDNIWNYHENQVPIDWCEEKEDGSSWGVKYTAIESVGLYVPGGRAPYPSSVLMDAVPAKIAGVDRIVMVTPPNKQGKIAPQVLVAADICGVSEIYKVGGSQAVFALAYGTETIKKVDKVVGPGNIYVTVAKQMVYGQIDIDKPAGPSEALVYVNQEKYVGFAAAELLSQLEHDPNAMAVGISENKGVLEAIQKELAVQIEKCSRKDVIIESLKNSALILTKDKKESIAAMNAVASEHLVLLLDEYEDVLVEIRHAGAVFLGPYTPVALGDYYAGTNHVLPTCGAARFASPLGVMDFMKYYSKLLYNKDNLVAVKDDVKILSEMEGFDAHYRAVDIRLK
jgi:histidinol dehydrogenase